MKTSIPDKYVLEENITVDLDGNSFDFLVKCSAFGEVISVKNLFFELPKEAQKMMLGTSYEAMIPKIAALEKLFYFRIPVSYGIGSAFGNKDKTVRDFVGRMLDLKESSTGLRRDEFRLDVLGNGWARQFFKIITNPKNSSDRNIAFALQGLTEIFSGEKGQLSKGLGAISTYKFFIGQPILKAVLPLLETNEEKRVGFNTFSIFPSAENKEFLLAEYAKEENKDFRDSIIYGLSKNRGADIYQFFLKQYYEKAASIGSLMGALENFKTKEVVGIAWDVFQNFKDGSNSMVAHRSLLKLGVTEKAITEKLRHEFYNSEDPKVLKTVLSRLYEIKNYHLYPPIDDLFSLLKKLSKGQSHGDHGTVFSKLTAFRFNRSVPEKLYEILSSDNESLRRAGVWLFGGYVDDFDFMTNWKPSEKFILKLEEMFRGETQYHRQKILKRLGSAASKFHKPMLRDILFDIASDEKYEDVRANAVKSLRNALNYVPYDESYTEFLISCLDSGSTEFKMDLVVILRKSKKPAAREELHLLKHGTDEKLRRMISERLMPEDFDDYGFFKYLENRKYELAAEYTLKERLKYFYEARFKN